MDAIPVIDLRLLTQAELNALAASSASSALDPRRADDIIVPKIDRSVFNESAGSRKQTYSRLRLAPPKAASSGPSPASTSSRRRGRPRSTARALPGNATSSAAQSGAPDASAALDEQERKENEQIIQFLRQLFANNGRTENLTPPKLSLNPKPVPVPEISLTTTSAPNVNGEASRLPENAAPVLDGVPPANAPKKRGRKKKLDKEEFGLSFTDTEGNDRELLNVNDVPVDLSRLGEKENLFREELIKRTEGLVTEEEFLDYLTVLEGRWGSRRKRRKLVDAAGFGDWLPKGWKLLLGLKRQGRSVWLHCRRFVSPSGKQFKSCKEISQYLLSLVGAEGIIKTTDSIKVDENNTPGSDNSPNGSAAGPVDQASTGIETPSCSLSSPTKVEIAAEVHLSSLLECQKCNVTFPDKEGHAQHLLSVHRKSLKRCRHGKSITDGVIVKDGIYECQFCHKVFNERHRYNGHVGVHAKDYSESAQGLSNDTTIDHVPESSTLAGSLTPSEINPTFQNERLNIANNAISRIMQEHAASIAETSEYEKAEGSSSPISYTPDPAFELSHNSSNSQVDNCNGVDEMKVDDHTCNEMHSGLSVQFDNSNIYQITTGTVCTEEDNTIPDCTTDISRMAFNSALEKTSMPDDQQVVGLKMDIMRNECIDSNSHTKFSIPHITKGSSNNRIDFGNTSSEGFVSSTDIMVDVTPVCHATTEFLEPSFDILSGVPADCKVINLILTEKEPDLLSMNVEASEPAFDTPSSIPDGDIIQLADVEKGIKVSIMKAESSELSANASVEKSDKCTTSMDSGSIFENHSNMTDSGLAQNYSKVECNEAPSCISACGNYYRTVQKLGDALSDAYASAHLNPETKPMHAAMLGENGPVVSLDANPQDMVNVTSRNAAQYNEEIDTHLDSSQNARDLAFTKAASPVCESYTGKLGSLCNPECILSQTLTVVKDDSTGKDDNPQVLANESSGDTGHSSQVINTSSKLSPDVRGLILTNVGSSICEISTGNSVSHCSPESKIAQTATAAGTDGGDYVDPQDLANKPPNSILESNNICFTQSADVRGLMHTDAKTFSCEISTGKVVSVINAQNLTNNISSSNAQSIVESDNSSNQSLDVRGLGQTNVGSSLNPTINQGKDHRNEDNLSSDCHLARLSTTWPSSSENDLFSNPSLEEIDNSLCEHQFFMEHDLSSPHVGVSSYQNHTGDNDIMCEGVASHESLNFDSFNKQDTHLRDETVDNSEHVEQGSCARLEGDKSSHPDSLGGLSDGNQNCSVKNQMLAMLPSDDQNSTAVKGSNSRLGGDFRYNPDECKDDYERNGIENTSANTYPWMHPSNFLSMSMMPVQDAEKLYYTNQKHNYTDFEGLQLENFNSSNPIMSSNQLSQFMPEVQINSTGSRELGNVFESSIQSDWDAATANLDIRHHQLPAVCIWCGSAFRQQGINHQTQQESIGFICSSCKSKFSVQLKF